MAELDNLPGWLTERETADLFGISVPSLRGLERTGKIRSFRPTPRKIRYLR
jgi:hypothetical protein